MNNQCLEIEDLAKKDTQIMYERIKAVTNRKRLHTGNSIKKENGTVAREENEVMDRWKEHVEELFEDMRDEQMQLDVRMEGPPILKEEIERAMQKMKAGKSTGEDKVNIEMLNAVKTFSIEKITKLANTIL